MSRTTDNLIDKMNNPEINDIHYEQQRDAEDCEMYEASRKVAAAMIKHGGSFVAALGEALSKADGENATRIKAAFSEYWSEYLNVYNTKMQKKSIKEYTLWLSREKLNYNMTDEEADNLMLSFGLRKNQHVL